jgi:hypothetical protein
MVKTHIQLLDKSDNIVKLLTNMREVLDANLSKNTAYPDRSFVAFTQSRHRNAGIAP